MRTRRTFLSWGAASLTLATAGVPALAGADVASRHDRNPPPEE